MSTKRKKIPAETKAKIALESARESKTISQIASEYEVHPTQVSEWKKVLSMRAKELFQTHAKDKTDSTLQARLYQEIGQLKMELDWLKKKLG